MEYIWITRKRFLVINFLHMVHQVIILKEFIMVSHTKQKERQNQFHEQQGQGPLSQEMTSKTKVQFQCRRLREGRRP